MLGFCGGGTGLVGYLSSLRLVNSSTIMTPTSLENLVLVTFKYVIITSIRFKVCNIVFKGERLEIYCGECAPEVCKQRS